MEGLGAGTGRPRWSRRQESNLYFTLRRHAHYPLCYGEGWGILGCPPKWIVLGFCGVAVCL